MSREHQAPDAAHHSQYDAISRTESMKGAPEIQLSPCSVPPIIRENP